MKKILCYFIGVLILITTLVFSACNEDKKSESEPEVLYQLTGDMRTDSMFDVNELYLDQPNIKSANIEYGSATGLSAFKFESVAYEPKGLTSTWVFAVMGLPNESKFPEPENGYPAVVLIHGGGGQVYTEWIRWWNARGYVALAFDTYSNELDEKGNLVKNTEGGPGSSDGPLADKSADYKNSWVYHNVINIIYCNNILRNRDDIDDKRICVSGISWGAVLCEIVSGVDNRFACFAPVYGAGYIFDDTNWQKAAQNYGGMAFDDGNIERWKNYFDPTAYVGYCYKPILFVSGIDDICFSTVSRVKTYALAKGKTFYAQHYDLGHGHVWYKMPEIYYFFNHVLYGEEYLLVSKTESNDGLISFAVNMSNYSAANLIYTKSVDEDSHDWIWQTEPVYAENGIIMVPIQEDFTAFYIEFSYDEDEYYKTSSEIIFNKDIVNLR